MFLQATICLLMFAGGKSLFVHENFSLDLNAVLNLSRELVLYGNNVPCTIGILN